MIDLHRLSVTTIPLTFCNYTISSSNNGCTNAIGNIKSWMIVTSRTSR